MLPRREPLDNPDMRAFIEEAASASTRSERRLHLSYLLGYLVVEEGCPVDVDLGRWQQVTFEGRAVAHRPCPPEVLTGFVAFITEREPARLRRLLYTARVFLRWLHHEGRTSQDLSLFLPTRVPGPDVVVREYYHPYEVEALIEATSDPWERLVLVMLGHGYRCQEIGRMRWEDVGADDLVVHGKTGDVRMPLSAELLAAIAAVPGPRRGPFFPRYLDRHGRLRGRPWNAHVNGIIRRAAERAGLPKERWGTSRWFRRGVAQFLHDTGSDVLLISQYLRHKRVSTTEEHYLLVSRTPRAQERLRRIEERRPSTLVAKEVIGGWPRRGG